MLFKANVDNAQVFIGDKFNYEIQVTAPENAIVDLPSFVGNLGSFEVKEMKNEKITEGMPKGTAKFTWLATLNTFVSGDFLIAPQEVNAVVGTDTVKTHTDPVAVKVSNRTTGEEADILEVEDPLSDPRLPQWLYVLLAVLGVALLVFLGWFLHKKFAKRGEAPQLPPYEEAVLTSCRLGSLPAATLSAVLKSIFSMRLSRNSRSACRMSQGSRRRTRNPW